MKNKIILIFIFVCIIWGLFAWINPFHFSKTNNNILPYISLTTTEATDIIDNRKNYFYTYNILDNTSKEVFKSDDNSGYPIGTVDEINKKVYYINRVNGTDQIFCHDFNNDLDYQLNTDIIHVNDMYVLNNSLYMLAGTKNGRNIGLIKLDLKTNRYKRFTTGNFFVTKMSYSKMNNKIYFTYSDRDKEIVDLKELGKINNDAPSVYIPKYYIDCINLKDDSIENVYDDNKVLDRIAILDDGKTMLMRTADKLIGPKYYYLFNIESKTFIRKLNVDNINLSDMVCFDNKIYYLGGSSETDFDSPNSVFCYDLDTMKSKYIVNFKNKYINNFSIYF